MAQLSSCLAVFFVEGMCGAVAARTAAVEANCYLCNLCGLSHRAFAHLVDYY